MLRLELERFMRHSNGIEGEFEKHDSFIDPLGGVRPRIGALHPRDLEAAALVYTLAGRGDKPDAKTLLRIHGMLSEHRDMQWKGAYRECAVYIGRREGLEWRKVPKAIDDLFLHWPMLSSWRMHALYEQIHPFEDLNGRTGRLLWMWRMIEEGKDPFQLPFLQLYYYQTLTHFQ